MTKFFSGMWGGQIRVHRILGWEGMAINYCVLSGGQAHGRKAHGGKPRVGKTIWGERDKMSPPQTP